MKKSSRAPKMRVPGNFSTIHSRIISRRLAFCRAWARRSNKLPASRDSSLAAFGETRVQRVAQRVAEQIEAHQSKENKKSGEKHLQRGDKNIGGGVGQQVAPTGRWRLDTEAEKTQCRLGADSSAGV